MDQVIEDYIALRRRVNKLKAELEIAKVLAEQQEEAALARMLEMGVSSMKCDTDDGHATVFMKTDMRAGLVDGVQRPDAVQAVSLFEPGMVKLDFNWNTMSAYIREIASEMDPLLPKSEAVPEALRPYIKLYEEKSVQVRFTE